MLVNDDTEFSFPRMPGTEWCAVFPDCHEEWSIDQSRAQKWWNNGDGDGRFYGSMTGNGTSDYQKLNSG